MRKPAAEEGQLSLIPVGQRWFECADQSQGQRGGKKSQDNHCEAVRTTV